MDGLISVIIPTYRRANMLREAIQSVKMQDYPQVEIIAVDDNSWDETSKIAGEFPDVVFLRNDVNKGPGYSRKRGFEYSHGEYVVFLDDDDYYTDPSFFSHCVEKLKERDDATLVVADAHVLDVVTGTYQENERKRYGWMPCVDYLRDFNRGQPGPLSTFTSMFSRKMLLKAGIMDMTMVNDIALYLKSLTNGYVYFMKTFIGVYRVHGANISKRITGDFVISNLEEKLEVYKMIADKKLFEDYDQWWFRHMDVTVRYYVYGSQPTLSDFRKVRKWCMANGTMQSELRAKLDQCQSYLIDYWICRAKCKIKKMLGLKVE